MHMFFFFFFFLGGGGGGVGWQSTETGFFLDETDICILKVLCLNTCTRK